MPNIKNSVIISGVGSYLPSRVLTNKDLTAIVETSEEWIFSRTGITERRIAAENEASSDMGVMAAKAALLDANLRPEDIDLLVVATITPDMEFPSTAALLQAKLGMRNVMSFDVVAACSGFLYSLEVVSKMLSSGAYKRALVVGAEKLTSVVDWEDRTTCVLFGDGAGAFVLEHSSKSSLSVIDSVLGVDGANPEILCIPAGGSKMPATEESVKNRLHFMKMNGKEVFKVAVRWMEQSVIDLLARNRLTVNDVCCLIPHQANLRIIETLAQRLGLPMSKVYCNLDKVGNTSAASIPIAFSEARMKNYFTSEGYIVLVAFGGGLTWGATLIKI